MKAWQPILTPKTVLPLLFGVGVIFAPIGGLLLYASSKVQEISIDYSKCTIEAPDCSGSGTFGPVPDSAVSMSFHKEVADDDKPTWCKETNYVGYGGTTNVTTPTCRIQFYVPEDLKTPVLLYYQLTNFYQNHRRYVKSFDQAQLNGEFRDNSSIDASDCDPLQLGEAASRNELVGKQAEAGVDAVHRLSTRDDALDRGGGSAHAVHTGGVEAGRRAGPELAQCGEVDGFEVEGEHGCGV